MQYPPVPLCAFRGIQCIVILKKMAPYKGSNLEICVISKFLLTFFNWKNTNSPYRKSAHYVGYSVSVTFTEYSLLSDLIRIFLPLWAERVCWQIIVLSISTPSLFFNLQE